MIVIHVCKEERVARLPIPSPASVPVDTQETDAKQMWTNAIPILAKMAQHVMMESMVTPVPAPLATQGQNVSIY